MKVTHICALDRGGAFEAAYNLHMGLIKIGVDSRVLILKKSKSNLIQVYCFLDNRSFLNRIKDSVNYRFFKYKKSRLLHKHKHKQTQSLYSFHISPYNLLKHNLVQSADIIHLHWIREFIDYHSFFRSSNKPIIWTLHDKNPFSGGFHFDTYVDHSFSKIDRYIKDQKKKALKAAKNLTVVSPSLWLLNESKKSEVLGKFNHYHIPYGVNLELFRPYNKIDVRKELNLPLDKKIVLFISDSVEDPRKGIQVLYDALSLNEIDFILVTVGGQRNSETTSDVISFGFITDKQRLSKIYSAADVFVIPSVEDNLPNTVLESLACGTPVVGFKVGGIVDMVKHGVNGYIANKISSQNLLLGINYVLSNTHLFESSSIRQLTANIFGLDQQAERYSKLYASIKVTK